MICRRSGGMRAKVASADDVTEGQVKMLETSVAQLQADLAKCRKSIKETEDTIKELNKCSQEQSILAEKCAQVMSRASEESTELSSRIGSLQSEIAMTPDEKKQVSALQKRLDSIEAEMQRVAPGLKGLEAEVGDIQKQILDIGGPKLKRAQAKLDAISLELDNLNASVSKTEVEVLTAKKNATKANSAHTKAAVELEKITAKISDLQREKTEMENDALVVIQAVEQAKTLMVAQEQQLSSTQKEYDALKNEVKKISIVQVDQKDEIDKCVVIISENEKQKIAWERKLDELRVKYMEDARENLKFSVSAAPQRNAFHCEGGMEVDTAATEQIVELPVLNEEELERAKDNVPNLKKQVCLLEEESNKLKEKVNMSDLLSYIAKDADYRSRLEELEAVTAERNIVRKAFEDLRRQRLEEFMAGFGVITLKLKEMYQMITLGGDAELELVDSLDPFSEGIVFSVRPPKKSWKNISNLSGGEKTLSSLALVFALHHYKPTPLYVMDEIDAALDFKNVSIVANYIKERTKNAQFVIISLRNNMFELADRLVGIYKTNDATKSVTVNPKMFDSAVAGGPPRVSSEPLSDRTNIAVSGGGEVVADKPAAQGSLRRTGRALW
jgi:structural maintenance of chromosome 4